MMLYDSIIPCFGSRLTVVTLPSAQKYRVHPLGTFHYFDWRKTDKVGVSIGTCPQIVSSETARIGVRVGDETRILPFDSAGKIAHFTNLDQQITPLTTIITAHDARLGITATFAFQSMFYPQSFKYSCAPCYRVEISVISDNDMPIEVFFGLPLHNAELLPNGFRSVQDLVFPDGIDHKGIDNLTFEQVIMGEHAHCSMEDGYALVTTRLQSPNGKLQSGTFFHAGYIPEPTLNLRGKTLRFGYTTLWDNALDVVRWAQSQCDIIRRNSDFFESTMMDATVSPELKMILSSTFKGLASNTWWAEDDWFSIMEIGAYHSTLDVDYQLCLFFFQYWTDLIGLMLNQWADFYVVGSGYMAHDVGQHLEATGNRYGGPESAMKVEENCNYILLLHHYWRSTADHDLLKSKFASVRELVDFLIASDTDGTGLPNRYADNTNDWGSALITASEEQSYHGVRMVVVFTMVAQMAEFLGDHDYATRCTDHMTLINNSLEKGWLGDHYPISLADPSTFHHYSMWTTHGLLYALRSGLKTPLDLEKLKIDLISSTARTLREHGCIHSTADVRGWLTQNLWRDSIAGYLGVDLTGNLKRYLGHGEYVSYEDTTILEVANELMVVPGAIAEHTQAGQIHDYPMVDGHPRPACGFGLLYALAGVQYDRITSRLTVNPVAFPLKIPLTHLADWENYNMLWLEFSRSIPNQDDGFKQTTVSFAVIGDQSLVGELDVQFASAVTR